MLPLRELPAWVEFGHVAFPDDLRHLTSIGSYLRVLNRVLHFHHELLGHGHSQISLRTLPSKSRTSGVYYLSPSTLVDCGQGSTLDFLEEIHLVDGELLLGSYAYSYHRPSGYWFRYEYKKDAHGDKHFEPDAHVHAVYYEGQNQFDQPRLAAGLVNLCWVLGSIRANFWDPKHRTKSPS